MFPYVLLLNPSWKKWIVIPIKLLFERLITIDCSRQNESVNSGIVDVRLKFEFKENVFANTIAVYCFIHDRVIEYNSMSNVVRKILDKVRKVLRFLVECLSMDWPMGRRNYPVQHDETFDYNGYNRMRKRMTTIRLSFTLKDVKNVNCWLIYSIVTIWRVTLRHLSYTIKN